MLPEPLLPLPPQSVEVLFDVSLPQVSSDSQASTITTSALTDQSSSQADPTVQSAQLPWKPCAVLTTQRNSFGLFRLYDEASIPSASNPEDQSGANPLPTEVHMSPPSPSSMNPFHPYPNENSWHLSDWYWNQGVQKSKSSFKKFVAIITSLDFYSEDLYCTNWVAIDGQLGSLDTVHDPLQASTMAPNSAECQVEDGGWMQKDITISVPFPQHSSHPGPRDYIIFNFYCQPLLLIIHEALSDPVHCKSFHFEPYLL